jgi:2-hydroxycyclohexanecarboxyl-CoA dehydrogenase
MVAVVTGAASGLGKAVATAFARRGETVALLDRGADRLASVVDELRASNGHIEGIAVDVAEAADVSAAFDRVRAMLGGVRILVNAAGIADLRPAAELPLRVFNRTFAVNVAGTFLCCQEAALDMRAAGFGRIVNIASVSGLRASVGRAAYGPSKAAVISLTQHLAVEWAAFGITVNAIAPGPIETPMVEAVHTEAARAAYCTRVPAGRYGLPGEIASAVEYLVSEEARYVTGQTLAVDGGYAVAGILAAATLQAGRPLATAL